MPFIFRKFCPPEYTRPHPSERLISLQEHSLLHICNRHRLMSAGMLQRPVLGTSTLHGQRSVLRAPLGLSRKTVTSVTTCSQRRQELKPLHVAKLASAALAASLLLSAAVPEDALAARSGGRVGGSSFRSSAPRAAPRAAPSAPRSRYLVFMRH